MSSDPTAVFAVQLKDETSGAAKAAAGSLQDLRGQIDGDIKALRDMQKAMRNLKGGTSTNIAVFRELRDRITAKKAAVAAAQSRYVALGGTFGKTTPKVVKSSSSFEQLTSALSSTNGPIGAFGARLASLGSLLANPVTLVLALTAATLALVTASVVATAALLRYGVAQSDARRSEALRLEGLNSLRHQFGMTTASVGAMQAAIDRASDSTNLGRGQLAGYARQLSRAGLRGESLAQAVEAMGIAQMVQGDRGAARFRAMAVNARLTGRSVDDLSASFRERLGPIARRQMLSLENQTARFRRSLDRLFSGLRIESFLGAMDEVASLFSQSSASGRALKSIVEALFQPMIDQLGTLGPVARRFFQGMVIGGLLVTIGILRVRNALRSTFGDSDLFKHIDLLQVALWAGVVAVGGLVLAVGLLGAAFAVVAVAAAGWLAVLTAGPALLLAVGAGIVLGVGAAVKWLQETDFRALATTMIDGLVAGLTAGVARVTGAVRGLASSASRAFREALGIASPSRVFAEFGANISAGVSQGIDSGASGVEASVGGLVDTPEGGGLGGAASVSIGDIIVHVGESSEPREIAVAIREALADLLGGVSIELGAT